MVAIYPVSGSVRHVRSLVDIDALNAGVELVYVPVCHFHKASPCAPSDEFKSKPPARQRLYTWEVVRVIGALSFHPYYTHKADGIHRLAGIPTPSSRLLTIAFQSETRMNLAERWSIAMR